MKSLLLIALVAAAIAASAGCCKDCIRTKPAGPKIEEYPLPPAPPDTRLK